MNKRTSISKTSLERLKAAEEVCFCLLIMMEVGLLEIPLENRTLLGEPMKEWSDFAFRDKIISDIGHSELASNLDI